MELLVQTVRREKASELLGISPEAERQAVRRAFCKLAFACHPDLFGGDPEMANRFNLLSEAYRVMTENIDTEIEQDLPPKTPAYPFRGNDLRFRLHLDPAFAAEGGEVSFRFQRQASRNPGVAAEPVILQVDVPAGLKDGDQIRLAGQGEPGKNGEAAGDLYITVSIKD